jgi:hypothetical protein
MDQSRGKPLLERMSRELTSRLRPLPGHPEPLRQGPEGGGGGAVIAWPLHVGPTRTPIVCRIAKGETQIFGCDLNSKFSFINTVKNLQ